MAINNGSDEENTKIGNLLVGMYYYISELEDECKYLGYTDAIQTVTFNPFVQYEDINNITKCKFDYEKYGANDADRPCYRILSFDEIDKKIGEYSVFTGKSNSNMTNDWYEPKLECYPFRYFLITDYINPPLLIKPEYINSANNKMEIRVKTCALSQQAKYNIYVKDYKNDSNGNLNGIVNTTSYMLPVSSSAYSNFLATSSNTFNQANANSLLENDLTLKQGYAANNLSLAHSNQNADFSTATNMIGLFANALSANIGGMVGNIGNMLQNNLTKTQNMQSVNLSNTQLSQRKQLSDFEINSMANAKKQDLINTPNTIKTCGNDTIFNMVNSKKRVDVIEYVLSPAYYERLRDYFQKYGYKVNEWNYITLRTRKYFDFIKTTICNIQSNYIPPEYVEEIKEIFNKGITFWHNEANANVGQYNYDQLNGNVEV